MSTDPNWKAGNTGQNAPANNAPDANYEYQKGVQAKQAEHNKKMAQTWGNKS